MATHEGCGPGAVWSMVMMRDLALLAGALAANERITDYDFWRALRSIEHELYARQRDRRPIPIRLLYARRLLSAARGRRRRGGDRT